MFRVGSLRYLIVVRIKEGGKHKSKRKASSAITDYLGKLLVLIPCSSSFNEPK
jgi:hypothetical protein